MMQEQLPGQLHWELLGLEQGPANNDGGERRDGEMEVKHNSQHTKTNPIRTIPTAHITHKTYQLVQIINGLVEVGSSLYLKK